MEGIIKSSKGGGITPIVLGLSMENVEIRKPPGTGSYFFNYKNIFSVILMAVANANYEFIMVDV
jgi:hypothetical protein